MKTGELSRRINTHGNTIRQWCALYADRLSNGAKGKGRNVTRQLTDQDAIILATVAHYRGQGLTHEQIGKALDAGKFVDSLPDVPPPEVDAMRDRVLPVPMPEYQRVAGLVQVKDNQIATLEADLDEAHADVTSLQERITQLSQELGKWRGIVYAGILALLILAIVAVALAAVLLTRGG